MEGRNTRMFELVENAPKTGGSPTIWAFPAVLEWLKVAGQPVAGPWPPHQQPRPDPDDESLPVAVAEPDAEPSPGPTSASAEARAAAPDDRLKPASCAPSPEAEPLPPAEPED